MGEIIYVINDMSAKLSTSNVEIINQLTELNFDDAENVTYQMLIDARKQSMSMAYGYPMYLNGVEFWVLPSLPMGLTFKKNNPSIKEYSYDQYVNDVLDTWDIQEQQDF